MHKQSAARSGTGPLVVLAYSGGLDTSAIVPWLREQYGARVVCFAADVGHAPAAAVTILRATSQAPARNAELAPGD